MKKNFWQQYAAFFDVFPQGILAYQDGSLLYANSAAHALLDNQKETLLPVLEKMRKEGSVQASFGNLNFAGIEYAAFFLPVEDTTGVVLSRVEPDGILGEDSSLIAAVGGQFRMPLTMIFSAVSLLYSSGDMKNDEKCDQYLSVISQNCHKLLRLSNNITNIAEIHSHQTAFNPAPANLASFVQTLVQQVTPYARMLDIELAFRSDAAPVVTRIDRDKIERMLLNLIANALSDAPPKSTVTVSVSSVSGQVFLSVSDTGPGIPAHILPYVFNRFAFHSLIGAEAKTLGLGLSIVKAIAEMHGGSLALESNPASGTRVTVSLPVTEQDEFTVQTPLLDFDYAGGFSHILLELCDVLPYAVYSKLESKQSAGNGTLPKA